MIVQDHDRDLQWAETDRNHDLVSHLKEGGVDIGTRDGPLKLEGNLILHIQEGEILVKGEAGGVWDEDPAGPGLEVRNLNLW